VEIANMLADLHSKQKGNSYQPASLSLKILAELEKH